MSATGDDSNPCHPENSHTVLPFIPFLLIFYSLIVSLEGPLGLASESPSASHKSEIRSEFLTEHFASFPDVYFDPDSMQLDETAERDLQTVIHYLRTHPNGRVRLDGHVDDHYSWDYGHVLSGKRADLVKLYLRQRGVTNPIEAHGYSHGRSVCVERNEECKRKNNRVHILMIEFRKMPKPEPMMMSPDSHGSAPRTTEAAPVQTSHPAHSNGEVAPTFEFPTVYFQRNSFQLDKKARTSLTPLVEHLKSHPDLQIQLIGRVDERHTTVYGLTLSSKRAEAVKKFLQQHGVKNVIKTQGVGKEKPICFEHIEACYRLSNQVDVLRNEVSVHE